MIMIRYEKKKDVMQKDRQMDKQIIPIGCLDKILQPDWIRARTGLIKIKKH